MRVAPSEIEDERLMPSSSESPRHRVAFQPLKAPAEVRLDPAVDVLQAVGQPPGAISQPAPDETTRRFRWPIAGARYDSIDTAGAMHAANEMIWFHSDEINGFPDVHLP